MDGYNLIKSKSDLSGFKVEINGNIDNNNVKLEAVMDI